MKSMKVNKIEAFFMKPVDVDMFGDTISIPIIPTQELHMFAPLFDSNIKGKQFETAVIKLIDDVLGKVFPDATEEQRKDFPMGRSFALLEKVMEINEFEVDDSKKKQLTALTQGATLTHS